ncbi:MAG: WhiB family transcriptional regulator [Streptosporangiales bacterium]|nr:WhiB family transcriptional regulator [Streptosporangiales bacterium]
MALLLTTLLSAGDAFPGDWVDRAACAGRDPELFYPVGTQGPALRQIAAAKAVCERCRVRDDCLGHALDAGEAHGIWGGTTPEERRTLRRETRNGRDGTPCHVARLRAAT